MHVYSKEYPQLEQMDEYPPKFNLPGSESTCQMHIYHIANIQNQ